MIFRLKNFSVLLAILAFSVSSCKDEVEPTDSCENTSIVIAHTVIENTAIISAYHGAAPYTYSLDGASFISGHAFSDLNPGEYTVSAKDANGCTASIGISIPEPDTTILTDSRDGRIYKLVTIGEQTWMAENLNYETSESYCYEDNAENCNNYGKLYTWEAAKTACPSGYHLPSDDEWKTLESALGMPEEDLDKSSGRGTDEGTKIKEGGSSGFEAKLGGYKTRTTYFQAGKDGLFWSSSVSPNPEFIHIRLVSDRQTEIWSDRRYKGAAISVRCVAD